MLEPARAPLISLVIAAALTLALGACSKEEAPPEPEPSGPVAGTTPRATLDRVKVKTDLAALRKGIQMYKTDHEGALPGSIDDIGVSGLFYADHYAYDAGTGDVRCPELPEL